MDTLNSSHWFVSCEVVNNYWLKPWAMMQAKRVLEGIDSREVEFPFKVSPAERAIIEKCQPDPRPIIVIGRSGTGKTICAVYRMWSQWLLHHKQEDRLNQLFITASATLKQQVCKSNPSVSKISLPAQLSFLCKVLKEANVYLFRWKRVFAGCRWQVCAGKTGQG